MTISTASGRASEMYAQYDDYNTIWDGDDYYPYTPCANCGADCKDFDLDENGVCADCAEEGEVVDV